MRLLHSDSSFLFQRDEILLGLYRSGVLALGRLSIWVCAPAPVWYRASLQICWALPDLHSEALPSSFPSWSCQVLVATAGFSSGSFCIPKFISIVAFVAGYDTTCTFSFKSSAWMDSSGIWGWQRQWRERNFSRRFHCGKSWVSCIKLTAPSRRFYRSSTRLGSFQAGYIT